MELSYKLVDKRVLCRYKAFGVFYVDYADIRLWDDADMRCTRSHLGM